MTRWRWPISRPRGEPGILACVDGAVAVRFTLDEAHAEGHIIDGLTETFIDRAALLYRPDESFAPVFVVRRDGWFLVAGPFQSRYQPIDDAQPPPPPPPPGPVQRAASTA